MTVASVVQSLGTAGAAATNAVINLPSGLTVGNTLLMCVRKDNQTSLTNPSGWNELGNSGADASNDRIYLGWRKVDGTEGSTVTVNGSSSSKFAGMVWEWAAADPAVDPPEVTAVNTGSSVNPDSTSLTPSGGTDDYAYQSVGGWQQGLDPTYPTNYTHGQNFVKSTGGSAESNVTVAGAARQLTGSTSEDPGSFTLASSQAWMMFTVAFYPIVAAGASSRQQMFGDNFRLGG